MPGLYLSVTFEGQKVLSRRLEGLATTLADLQKPLKTASDTLIEFFSSEVFDTQGDALGIPWEPLAPSTVAEKERLGYTSDPLIRTGNMRDSFEAVVTSNQSVIGNTAPYFQYHQSALPRHKLPRRVMMALDDQLKEQVVKTIQAYIIESTKGV